MCPMFERKNPSWTIWLRPHFSAVRKSVTSSDKCRIDSVIWHLSGEITLFLTAEKWGPGLLEFKTRLRDLGYVSSTVWWAGWGCHSILSPWDKVWNDSLDVIPGLSVSQAEEDPWQNQEVVQSVDSPHYHVALQVTGCSQKGKIFNALLKKLSNLNMGLTFDISECCD